MMGTRAKTALLILTTVLLIPVYTELVLMELISLHARVILDSMEVHVQMVRPSVFGGHQKHEDIHLDMNKQDIGINKLKCLHQVLIESPKLEFFLPQTFTHKITISRPFSSSTIFDIKPDVALSLVVCKACHKQCFIYLFIIFDEAKLKLHKLLQIAYY